MDESLPYDAGDPSGSGHTSRSTSARSSCSEDPTADISQRFGNRDADTCIGSGFSGEVFKIQRDGRQLAVKWSTSISNEVDHLQGLDHPNVVTLIDFDVEHNVMAMEYVDDTLANRVLNWSRETQGGKEVPNLEVNLLYILHQIIGALRYLHDEHRILHLDLRKDNVLLQHDTDSKLQWRRTVAKLCDFGCALKLKDDEPAIRREHNPTHLRYAPKEALDFEFGVEADVYSLGVLAWEMWSGQTAFEHELKGEILSAESMNRLHHSNQTLKRPCGQKDALCMLSMEQELWKVIEKCLHREPVQRPSLEVLETTVGRCLQEAELRSYRLLECRGFALDALKQDRHSGVMDAIGDFLKCEKLRAVDCDTADFPPDNLALSNLLRTACGKSLKTSAKRLGQTIPGHAVLKNTRRKRIGAYSRRPGAIARGLVRIFHGVDKNFGQFFWDPYSQPMVSREDFEEVWACHEALDFRPILVLGKWGEHSPPGASNQLYVVDAGTLLTDCTNDDTPIVLLYDLQAQQYAPILLENNDLLVQLGADIRCRFQELVPKDYKKLQRLLREIEEFSSRIKQELENWRKELSDELRDEFLREYRKECKLQPSLVDADRFQDDADTMLACPEMIVDGSQEQSINRLGFLVDFLSDSHDPVLSGMLTESGQHVEFARYGVTCIGGFLVQGSIRLVIDRISDDAVFVAVANLREQLVRLNLGLGSFSWRGYIVSASETTVTFRTDLSKQAASRLKMLYNELMKAASEKMKNAVHETVMEIQNPGGPGKKQHFQQAHCRLRRKEGKARGGQIFIATTLIAAGAAVGATVGGSISIIAGTVLGAVTFGGAAVPVIAGGLVIGAGVGAACGAVVGASVLHGTTASNKRERRELAYLHQAVEDMSTEKILNSIVEVCDQELVITNNAAIPRTRLRGDPVKPPAPPPRKRPEVTAGFPTGEYNKTSLNAVAQRIRNQVTFSCVSRDKDEKLFPRFWDKFSKTGCHHCGPAKKNASDWCQPHVKRELRNCQDITRFMEMIESRTGIPMYELLWHVSCTLHHFEGIQLTILEFVVLLATALGAVFDVVRPGGCVVRILPHTDRDGHPQDYKRSDYALWENPEVAHPQSTASCLFSPIILFVEKEDQIAFYSLEDPNKAILERIHRYPEDDIREEWMRQLVQFEVGRIRAKDNRRKSLLKSASTSAAMEGLEYTPPQHWLLVGYIYERLRRRGLSDEEWKALRKAFYIFALSELQKGRNRPSGHLRFILGCYWKFFPGFKVVWARAHGGNYAGPSSSPGSSGTTTKVDLSLQSILELCPNHIAAASFVLYELIKRGSYKVSKTEFPHWIPKNDSGKEVTSHDEAMMILLRMLQRKAARCAGSPY